eukprot:4179157-Amphidinium_carterae.4
MQWMYTKNCLRQHAQTYPQKRTWTHMCEADMQWMNTSSKDLFQFSIGRSGMAWPGQDQTLHLLISSQYPFTQCKQSLTNISNVDILMNIVLLSPLPSGDITPAGGLTMTQARQVHRFATQGRVLRGIKPMHSQGVHPNTRSKLRLLSALLAPHSVPPFDLSNSPP